jgi:hypothetical protein
MLGSDRSHLVHLQAFTWDWLMAIPEEYKIVRQARFSQPNIVYFLSRSVVYNGSFQLLVLSASAIARFGTFGCCLSTMIFRSDCPSHICPRLTD